MSLYEPNKMKNIPFTGIRRVLEKANKLEASGHKIIHFEAGLPDFDTPEHIKQAAKDALDRGMTKYASNFGLPSLREAIAKKLETFNGIKADPNTEIMVTSGGQEAVASAILALVDAGDEVLVSDPGYTPYASLVKAANAVPLGVPLVESDNFNFDLDTLESLITPRTKLLVYCSPGNPTGTMMERDKLARLAGICQKHSLLVISDEAYEQVVYDGNEHVSFATLPGMWERTVTVHSFSKAYAMCGWRIGYLSAPKELVSVIVRVHMNLVLSSTTFAQLGALAALNGPQASLGEMLEKFDERRKYMYEGLRSLAIPCNKPQAAFYLFPNISRLGMGSFEFAEYVLDNYGVAFVPGVEFGAMGEGFVRISYATSLENCKEGMERIAKAVKALEQKG